jgi:hypothetical protein
MLNLLHLKRLASEVAARVRANKSVRRSQKANSEKYT